MIHEVPDQNSLFKELKSILRPGGRLYIIEPKFHVSKKDFEKMLVRLDSIRFEVIESPRVFFSRAVLLAKRSDCNLAEDRIHLSGTSKINSFNSNQIVVAFCNIYLLILIHI